MLCLIKCNFTNIDNNYFHRIKNYEIKRDIEKYILQKYLWYNMNFLEKMN